MMSNLNALGRKLLLSGGLLAAAGFTPGPAHGPADTFIFVGIAYAPKKCSTTTFDDALAYQVVQFARGQQNYADAMSKLKADMKSAYPSATISVQTGQTAATILSYEKKFSGWNCAVRRFAVGFGSSCQSSNDAAIRSKNNEVGSSAPSQLVRQVNCL